MNLHGVLNKGQGRRLFAVGAVAALGLAIGASPSMATGGVGDNVLFCHATSSAENPYIVGIQTDPDSIIQAGHGDHTGPVFDLTGGQHQPTWGDIIPAFDYGDGRHFDGLNINAAGQGFLDRECQLPEEPDMVQLTLVKEVNNDAGGEAVPADWMLYADNNVLHFSGAGGLTHAVEPGTSFGLSESDQEVPANYEASSWDCVGEASLDGDLVTVGDEDVTCTIMNTYNPPETHRALQTLVKSVNNSAGGSAVPGDWTLDASGGATEFAAGKTGVNHMVANGTYTLSESGTPANYSPSTWVCTRPTVLDRAIAPVVSNTVVIGPNDTAVTCTITNTFVPPTITRITPDVPGISLVKTYTLSGTDALANAGETISYSFLVTNTGNVALTSVAVADLLAGVSAVSCPSTTLAVAASFSCTASYIVTSADATGVDITNEANASGQPPTGGRVQATAFVSTPTATPVVAPVVTPAPEVKGVVKNAPPKAAAPAVKTLAFTGAETVPLGLSGLLALLLGAVLTVASRQRPKKARE